MRKTVLLLLTAFIFYKISIAQDVHRYNPSIDVQHYDFSITINDSNNTITAHAAILVRFLQPVNSIKLDLINRNVQGKGMAVNGVVQDGAPLLFEHNGDILKINLRKPIALNDTATFLITYGGVPANGLVFSKNKFGQRTIFGDNWPNRARNWLPCVDHLSDKASVDFMVTAPDHYKVISNGELVEESSMDAHKKFTHWREAVELPTKVMAIGLADFAVNHAGIIDCIPVTSWVFPEDKKNGFYDYAQALEILPFFIKNVGPYAYKKLANVEAITIFGGMENAGAIFYSEQSINGKRSYSEELIAHEIAHQWFGNSATEADWPHVWLSEGFATVMTNLYLESKYGTDSLKARLKADRKMVIDFAKKRFTPIVDTSEKVNLLKLLNLNSYQKAGWVLHMLRRKLGDVLFWNGVRAYYEKYAGKNAATDDFRRVMEDVSGVDLKVFFKQWLYYPGHPILEMTWNYDERKKTLMLRIMQTQKQLFNFPLEFTFKYGTPTKTRNQSFLIKEKLTEIEISMDAKPSQVIADPVINLLFEGGIKEAKIAEH